jgi:hypothetical protein
MAWERSFEKQILRVRAKELKYYTIEVLSFQFSNPSLSDEVSGNRISYVLSGWYSSNQSLYTHKVF